MARAFRILAAVIALIGICWSQAQAQIPLTGAGVGAPGGAAAFATYVQTDNPPAQPSPGLTTVTFTSVNIGTAASNRVVVLVFTSGTAIATTATVGGVSMTKAIEESTTVSGLQIWYGTVSSGATANVVFTFGSNPADCMLVAGKFNSGSSVAPAGTPQSTVNGAGASTQTLNTTIPSGGFAVMAVAQITNTQVATWTNMTAAGGDITQTTGSFITIFTAHSTTAGSPTALGFSVPLSSPIHSVSAAWGP